MRSRGRGLLATSAAGVLALGMGGLPAGAQDATEPEVETVRGYASGVTFAFAANFGDAVIDVAFGPEPEVTLPSDGGGPFTESLPLALVEVDEEEDIELAAGIELSTEGALGPDGFATSSATIGEIDLEELELVGTELLEVECNSDIAGGPTGSTIIAGGEYYDPELDEIGALPEAPEANTVVIDWEDEIVDEDGVENISLLIVLNEQTVTDDDITVVGVRVSLSYEFVPTQGIGDSIQLDLVLGEATCGIDVVEPLEPVDPPLGPVEPVEPTEPVTSVAAAVVATPTFTG